MNTTAGRGLRDLLWEAYSCSGFHPVVACSLLLDHRRHGNCSSASGYRHDSARSQRRMPARHWPVPLSPPQGNFFSTLLIPIQSCHLAGACMTLHFLNVCCCCDALTRFVTATFL